MSTNPNNPIDRPIDKPIDKFAPIDNRAPAELMDIARALDELATADRVAASPSTERRVFDLTQGKLAAAVAVRNAPADAALDQLGEHDRQAARSTLEDRIFMATRASLRTVAAPHRVHVRAGASWGWRTARIAAGLLLATGVGVGYLAIRQSSPVVRPVKVNQLAALEKHLDSDVQQFAVALQVAFNGTDTDASAADHDTNGTADDWFKLDSLEGQGGTGEGSL